MGYHRECRVARSDKQAGRAAELLGEMKVQTHSESESDRAVLAFRGPDGQAATVIVIRKRGRVWLVLNGAEKTTIAMTDPQAAQLIEALRAASRNPR